MVQMIRIWKASKTECYEYQISASRTFCSSECWDYWSWPKRVQIIEVGWTVLMMWHFLYLLLSMTQPMRKQQQRQTIIAPSTPRTIHTQRGTSGCVRIGGRKTWNVDIKIKDYTKSWLSIKMSTSSCSIPIGWCVYPGVDKGGSVELLY